MQIDIKTRNFFLTDALRSHAEHRLRFALTSSNNHIQRVVMRLSEINGQRGGSDKRCHLKIILAGLPDIVIEDIESDMYAAISRAADQAGRSVIRKMRSKQTMHKQRQMHLINMK